MIESGGWTRRLGPLAMGVVALALMATIFPSALHLPILGPGGAPEVAPVPGANRQQSNVNEGSVADSGTVGSGGTSVTGGGGPIPSPPPGGGQVSIAQQSRCVGNPPRQTEDPLSPPCVAAWKGDNHGATWQGVTGAAITVVLEDNIYGLDGRDYTQFAAVDDTPYDATARLLLRYFQSRFVTYGRTVRLISNRTLSAADIEQRYKPFAVIGLRGGSEKIAAQAGTLYFGNMLRQGTGHSANSRLMESSPFYWSFESDSDAMLRAYTHYVCSGLVGRPAVMAGDPSFKAQTRKFGILRGSAGDQSTPFQSQLKAECGIDPPIYSLDNHTTTLAHLQTDGITTLLLASDDLMTDAATHNYLPEWVFMGGALEAQYNQRYRDQAEYQSAFGITTRWWWKAPPEPYWYGAALSSDPAASPDLYMGSSIYDGLLMTFTAIQRAGPSLTPSAVQRGLESFTASYSPPYSPHAGYGPGKHAFVDDFMIIRWDPSGSPPGGSPGSGCLRLADSAKRYSVSGPWPTSDRAAADDATEPCQADEVSLPAGTQDTRK